MKISIFIEKLRKSLKHFFKMTWMDTFAVESMQTWKQTMLFYVFDNSNLLTTFILYIYNDHLLNVGTVLPIGLIIGVS
jgi:hypothetical protein